MIIPDSINIENACTALESLARAQARSSAELGAVELAAHALMFITAPRPPEGSEHLRVEDVPPRTVITEWSSQGHLLDAYLGPWKDRIAQSGTPEQKAFIAFIEQPESPDFAEDEHDMETRPFADVLPEPAEAVRILEALAPQYHADSLNRSRVEFALHTLRYIIEHNQVDALGKYLDLAGKRRSIKVD